MGITRTSRSRQTNNGIWLFGSSEILTAPGNGSYSAARIVVPFKHKLIKAVFSGASVEKGGTMTASLKRSTIGGTADGLLVGTTISDTLLAASVDLMNQFEIALAAADKADQPATKFYHVVLVGTDAADIVKYPMLAILVQPIPRVAL